MRLKANKPVHSLGLLGHATQKAPLKAGAHMPMRDATGFNDARGYQDSAVRRNGRHTGKPAKGDTSLLRGAEKGNSRGTPPPSGKPGVRGTLASHAGDAGRGAPGKLGRGDDWKGNAKSLTEDISHDAFEKLGA